jgi:hypothetical protein
MKNNTTEQTEITACAKAFSGQGTRAHTADRPDKLVDFRVVNHLIGSRCRSSHTARALARRGLIKAVRINERVLRYSENSVRALVDNGAGL